MSSPKLSLLALPLILATLLLITIWSNSKHKYYSQGEEIYVRVNSLTSVSSLLSFDHYSLPYCKHNGRVRKGMENLGHLLMGEKLHSSLYRFHVRTNASLFLCTSDPLSKQEVDILRQSSIDMYQANMVLDGLPALRFVGFGWHLYRLLGFSVSYTPDGANYYIVNHLKFRVLVHREKNADVSGASPRFEIVGFEVIPCSVKHDSQALSGLKMYDRISSISTYDSQPIREKESVTFSYEVEFAETDVGWSSRWRTYLENENEQYHWFSFLNSLITTLFLAGCLLFRLSRTVCRDLSRRRRLLDDALKAPSRSMLLCVMVGNGVQVFSMSFVTISIAALGLIPPSPQGMLLIAFIASHCLFGFVAGYVSVWLWKNINGSLDGWRSVSWYASNLLNAIIFSIFTALNSIHYANGSTRAASVSVYATLVSLWLCISMPVTFLGGYLASSQSEKANETTALLVHEINQKTGTNRSCLTLPTWLLIPLSGMVTFGTMLMELYSIWSSIWFGRLYGDYCFMILAALLVVPSCATVSAIISYKCICVRDRNWWWKAFLASASSGFYAFLYAVKFMVFDLRGFNGPASTAIYLAYSLMFALGFALSAGATGVMCSLAFVRYLAAE